MDEINKLIGHRSLFNEFIYLDQLQKLPSNILLNGPSGIGKKIFVNHYLRYIYSKGKDDPYDLKNNILNVDDNLSKLILTNSYPNIFRIFKRKEKKLIDIDQIRDMVQFNNQTSFNNEKRFIIIENINLLSVNSINALLKSIEEPNNNTHFILINDSEFMIKETLKSRCLEFKIYLVNSEVRDIVNYHFQDEIYDKINSDFINNYNSPSFLISLIKYLERNELLINNTSIEDLLSHIIKNKSYTKDDFVKKYLNLFIEFFFYKNISKSKKISFKIKKYFYLKLSIVKKYNLDFESFLLEFNDKLLSE